MSKVRVRLVFGLLFCLCFVARSQSTGLKLPEVLKDKRMSANYTFTATDEKGRNASGRGSVTYQQGAFVFKADGIRLYNDGKTMWTVNNSAHEVIIEDAAPLDVTSDPDAVLALFGQNSKNATTSFTYSSNGIPSGISAQFKNGGSVKVKITDVELMPAGEMSDFSFDTSKLGKSYVITDLR